MALSSALYSSVAGLDTTSTAISVIGDNIANVNTPGFKERRAEFSEVLGQTITGVSGSSPLGQGAKLSQISTSYTQGSLETTARAEDLAIDGQGFFVLQGEEGLFYSRAGIFNFDKDGVFSDPSGMAVQGFSIDPATGLSTGERGDITRSNALAPPQATTAVDLSANLDPAAELRTFDAANPIDSSNLATGVTLYDSLGNQRLSTVYFNRTGDGTWDWTATLSPQDTSLTGAPGDVAIVQGSGSLAFDTAGTLTSATGSPITFEYAAGTPGLSVELSFGPIGGVGAGSATTSYGEIGSVTNTIGQDGFSAGTLSSISIATDGVLSGQFSNGETVPLAQIALATFPNMGGLQTVGNNNLIETRRSGQPLIGEPESGSFGSIRSGNLEQSTVDLAAEFVRLIVNQRAFQANTRTISTTNELLANLVALGQ